MNSQLLFEIGLFIFAYLFGSIPFSVLLGTKIKGVDVREHGSGNPGGTNSIRWLGKKVGLTIVFLDGLKGGLIILLVRFGVIELSYLPILAFGVIGALGHVFPIFLKFKGGKAVAATGGLLVGYNPIWAVISIITFFIVIKISKYVSVGSTSIPIVVLLLSLGFYVTNTNVFPHVLDMSYWIREFPFFILLLFLIVIRHKSNYNNIKNGVEPKVKWAIKKAE